MICDFVPSYAAYTNIECDHATGKVTNCCLNENNFEHGNSYSKIFDKQKESLFSICHVSYSCWFNESFGDHFCNEEIFVCFLIV